MPIPEDYDAFPPLSSDTSSSTNGDKPEGIYFIGLTFPCELVILVRQHLQLGDVFTAMTPRLDGLTMVVTLEPCAMCAGAIAQSRIKRLVFGSFDEKYGAVGSIWDLLRDGQAGYKLEVVSGDR